MIFHINGNCIHCCYHNLYGRWVPNSIEKDCAVVVFCCPSILLQHRKTAEHLFSYPWLIENKSRKESFLINAVKQAKNGLSCACAKIDTAKKWARFDHLFCFNFCFVRIKSNVLYFVAFNATRQWLFIWPIVNFGRMAAI